MFYRIVGVLKGVPKNFTNFTGKHLCRKKWEPKSSHYRRDTYTSCFQLVLLNSSSLVPTPGDNPESIDKLAINQKLSAKWR